MNSCSAVEAVPQQLLILGRFVVCQVPCLSQTVYPTRCWNLERITILLRWRKECLFFGTMRILTEPCHHRPREIRQVPQVPDGHGISTSEKRVLSGLKTDMKFPQNPWQCFPICQCTIVISPWLELPSLAINNMSSRSSIHRLVCYWIKCYWIATRSTGFPLVNYYFNGWNMKYIQILAYVSSESHNFSVFRF